LDKKTKLLVQAFQAKFDQVDSLGKLQLDLDTKEIDEFLFSNTTGSISLSNRVENGKAMIDLIIPHNKK
jgi:hypothetical protein